MWAFEDECFRNMSLIPANRAYKLQEIFTEQLLIILWFFQFVELNGMWLSEPRQAYVHLLKALTGQVVTAEQAQQLLERRFSRAAPRRITTLVLVDEVSTVTFSFGCCSRFSRTTYEKPMCMSALKLCVQT